VYRAPAPHVVVGRTAHESTGSGEAAGLSEFNDHFSAHADAYAAHRPTYPAALVDYLAELAPRADVAWEAGCGSGQLSMALAWRFDRVIATDASAEQLARATPHARIEYRRARAEDSGLPAAAGGRHAGGVDLAVAAQAAHWFDIEGYYAEVRRVAAPDAAVALVSYGPTRIAPEIDPLVEEFRVDVLAPYWAAERRHVEDGYASLPFPFAEQAPPELEMRAEWTLAGLLAYMRTWSALRALEPERVDELLGDLRRRLAPRWGAGGAGAADAAGAGTRRIVAWPLSVRAGYVTPD